MTTSRDRSVCASAPRGAAPGAEMNGDSSNVRVPLSSLRGTSEPTNSVPVPRQSVDTPRPFSLWWLGECEALCVCLSHLHARMLCVLSRGPISVSEMAREMGLDPRSGHLSHAWEHFNRFGLVRFTKRGRERIYELTDRACLSGDDDWLTIRLEASESLYIIACVRRVEWVAGRSC